MGFSEASFSSTPGHGTDNPWESTNEEEHGADTGISNSPNLKIGTVFKVTLTLYPIKYKYPYY